MAGWEFGELVGFLDCWLFRSSDAAGGGLGMRGESDGDDVRVYITVDSLETALEAAKANGSIASEGTYVVPPCPSVSFLLANCATHNVATETTVSQPERAT